MYISKNLNPSVIFKLKSHNLNPSVIFKLKSHISLFFQNFPNFNPMETMQNMILLIKKKRLIDDEKRLINGSDKFNCNSISVQ